VTTRANLLVRNSNPHQIRKLDKLDCVEQKDDLISIFFPILAGCAPITNIEKLAMDTKTLKICNEYIGRNKQERREERIFSQPFGINEKSEKMVLISFSSHQ